MFDRVSKNKYKGITVEVEQKLQQLEIAISKNKNDASVSRIIVELLEDAKDTDTEKFLSSNNINGSNLLQIAIEYCPEDQVVPFLEYINLKIFHSSNHENKTALLIAVEKNKTKILGELLQLHGDKKLFFGS